MNENGLLELEKLKSWKKLHPSYQLDFAIIVEKMHMEIHVFASVKHV